jgi:hypothetical protein
MIFPKLAVTSYKNKTNSTFFDFISSFNKKHKSESNDDYQAGTHLHFIASQSYPMMQFAILVQGLSANAKVTAKDQTTIDIELICLLIFQFQS